MRDEEALVISPAPLKGFLASIVNVNWLAALTSVLLSGNIFFYLGYTDENGGNLWMLIKVFVVGLLAASGIFYIGLTYPGLLAKAAEIGFERLMVFTGLLIIFLFAVAPSVMKIWKLKKTDYKVYNDRIEFPEETLNLMDIERIYQDYITLYLVKVKKREKDEILTGFGGRRKGSGQIGVISSYSIGVYLSAVPWYAFSFFQPGSNSY